MSFHPRSSIHPSIRTIHPSVPSVHPYYPFHSIDIGPQVLQSLLGDLRAGGEAALPWDPRTGVDGELGGEGCDGEGTDGAPGAGRGVGDGPGDKGGTGRLQAWARAAAAAKTGGAAAEAASASAEAAARARAAADGDRARERQGLAAVAGYLRSDRKSTDEPDPAGVAEDASTFQPGWAHLFEMNRSQLERALRRLSRDPALDPERRAYLMQHLLARRNGSMGLQMPVTLPPSGLSICPRVFPSIVPSIHISIHPSLHPSIDDIRTIPLSLSPPPQAARYVVGTQMRERGGDGMWGAPAAGPAADPLPRGGGGAGTAAGAATAAAALPFPLPPPTAAPAAPTTPAARHPLRPVAVAPTGAVCATTPPRTTRWIGTPRGGWSACGRGVLGRCGRPGARRGARRGAAAERAEFF